MMNIDDIYNIFQANPTINPSHARTLIKRQRNRVTIFKQLIAVGAFSNLFPYGRCATVRK
jgi:hypothetical protein